MAKQPHKKIVRKAGSGVGKRSPSLTAELRAVTAKARAVREQAKDIEKRSTEIHNKTDMVHQAADTVHHGAEYVHEKLERSKGKAGAQRPPPPTAQRFLIVGVGASAGGFEAFTRLLEKLPVNTGMAFILVQHLDPTHESQLTALLSRTTRLPVVPIENSTPVEPDHLYVIPQDKSLEIRNGILYLTARRKSDAPFLPIDRFFESLAHDQGNGAVGVILSGTGHDGTVGLQTIKAEGGLTFVQDEKTAKFFGMPNSAAHAGGIDFVLPPERIAEELTRVAQHASVRTPVKPGDHADLTGSEKHLARVFALLRAATGVDFSFYKMTTLRRRIARRMMLKKAETLSDYLLLLQRDPQEIDALFQDLLINVTAFFRDREVFHALVRKIFPKIIKQKGPGTPIRIWVPGCSTGEEVYSLAICLHEFLGRNLSNKSIQIFGTDISENMVNKARSGMYARNISAEVSPERLRRYFHRVEGGYQIAKFVRDVCIFAKQNVVEDPPFSKLDLISCRNLLIYLGPVLQKKVLPIFHYSLRPGGFLMLGTSETIGGFSNLFSLVDKKNKIYVRNETYAKPEMEFAPAATLEAPRSSVPMRQRREPAAFDFEKRADELLLTHYVPPGAIINGRMEVLQFRGKTGPYLEPSHGTASLNLLKMVREELVVDLRTAVMTAIKTDAPVVKEGVRLRSDGILREVKIEVVPLRTRASSERFLLVMFYEVSRPYDDSTGAGLAQPLSRKARQSQVEVRKLREEIMQTKDSLQAIIEEQEATNEELKSANEEIQSSNEELQSTNEELETAKEELQSTNEELTTLNEELQNRNVELSQANNDLNNLIGSFNMPMLMLDNDLRIRRFTPLAEKLFNLIPGDIGRRISDINPNITISNLDKIVADVIDSLNMREVEVQDREGYWYSLRVRPYRTSDNKIEGAVLVLVDIDEIREGLEEVVEMVPQPMMILTRDLRVSKANQAFHSTFQISKSATDGKLLAELSHEWNIPELHQKLEAILPDGSRIENFKIERDFPKIGPRTILVNARKLYPRNRGTYYILIRLDDISAK